MYVLLWIALGAPLGWLTGRILKDNQFGPWVDTAMGVAGSLAGGLLVEHGGFPGRSEIVSTTLCAVLGAVCLTVITASINRRTRYG